jgi:Putative restriction endonuclease
LCYKFAISRFVSANFCLKKINFAAMTITSLDQLDPNGIYTYADYLLWQFSERVELLRGKIRQMSAPSRKHQDISGKIQYALTTALLKSPCKVYNAPFDVRLTRTRKKKMPLR